MIIGGNFSPGGDLCSWRVVARSAESGGCKQKHTRVSGREDVVVKWRCQQ